jgi:hypothetical protein
MNKLFVVVRADIAPGLQLAQSGHAIVSFQHSYAGEYEEWYRGSNNLVILASRNEAELTKLAYSLTCKGVKVALFREPDLGDELTSIGVGSEGQKYLSCLPLALRQAA